MAAERPLRLNGFVHRSFQDWGASILRHESNRGWLMSWSIRCPFNRVPKWLTCLCKEASFARSRHNIKSCPNLGMVGSSAKFYIFYNWVSNPHVFWADITYHITIPPQILNWTQSLSMVNFRWIPGWKNEVCVALTAMARGNFYRGKRHEIFHLSWLPSSQKAFSDSWYHKK